MKAVKRIHNLSAPRNNLKAISTRPRGFLKSNIPMINKENFIQKAFRKTKEAFLDTNIEVTDTVTNTNINESNTTIANNSLYTAVKNDTNLYKEFETSMNKANEIVKKTYDEMNKAVEAIAEAKSSQTNVIEVGEMDFTGASNFTIRQENDAVSDIQLQTMVQSLNELDSSTVNVGLVADMIGLTGESKDEQSAKSQADQAAALAATNTNDTKIAAFRPNIRVTYGRECFADLEVGVHNTTTNTNKNTDNTTINNTDTTQITENSTVDKQIQKYCETISNRTEDIKSDVQNIKNNIAAVSNIDQSNMLKVGAIKAANSNGVLIEQINKKVDKIVNQYQDTMEKLYKLKSDNSLDSSTDATMGMKTETAKAADNAAKQVTDVVADNQNKMDLEVMTENREDVIEDTNSTTIWIVAIVVIGVLIIGGIALYCIFGKKKQEEAPEEEPLLNDESEQVTIVEPEPIEKVEEVEEQIPEPEPVKEEPVEEKPTDDLNIYATNGLAGGNIYYKYL